MLNRKCILGLLIIWGLAAWLCILPKTYAQQSSGETPPDEIIEKQVILLDLLRSINHLEQEIQETQKELNSPQGEGRKDEVCIRP